MKSSNRLIRKATELCMISLLFLLPGLVYGDSQQKLEEGESLVVLNVENMT